MESSILIYFSAAVSVIFLLVGGVIGWIWNDKTNQFLYAQADEEVVKIKELKDNYSFKRATTSGRDEKTTDSDTRESEVFWVEDNSDSRWIYNRIMECVVEANKKWGFSLTCSESIQYTKYSILHKLSQDCFIFSV